MSGTRISSMLGKITIVLVICCLITLSLCVNTAVALPGLGTQQKPWLIESLVDFNEFAADDNYWAGYTRLETDVNLAGQTYTTAVIAPDTDSSTTGFQGTAFTGVFDGNDHNIMNLTIEGGAGNGYLGFFGYTYDGTISNLGLEGGSISGDSCIGSLVAANQDGYVSKCFSTVSVSGTGRTVGGLAGASDGTIINCYSTGDVSGDDLSGGLVGDNSLGSISNCYSTGDVSGNERVGGLIGANHYIVSNCYSTGDVSGVLNVGGLVGYNYDSVSNSFWDTNSQTHGVTESIGYNDEGTITNVSGLTTAEMQTSNTFTDAGWDFIAERNNGTTETWQIPAGSGYPVLSFFHMDIPVPLSGSGTTTDPYLVTDANELGMVSWYSIDCYFEMIGDIDLSGIHWPIAVVPVFAGSFDGNGHKVLNVKILGDGHLGLFGDLTNPGQIRNLGIDGGFVSGRSGNSASGGLVGYNYMGSIFNCYSTVVVSGGWFAGGLVGYNWYGSISNCFSTGSVSGESRNGGLVGLNGWGSSVSNCFSTGPVSGGLVGGLIADNRYIVSNCYSTGDVIGDGGGGLVGLNFGSVSNCYSAGNVIGYDYAGGLVGRSRSEFISSCYSTGSVSGNTKVGGLVGFNDMGSSVSNCYSSADVEGVSEVGGLVGRNNSTSSVTSCFWDTDTQTHGITESIGFNDGGTITNVSGHTTVEMQTKSTFNDAGWDFINLWDICELTNYPKYIWQIPIGDFVCPDGVNFIDYSFFTLHWQEDNCDASDDCEGTDLDQLGTVDVNDFVIFLDSWLTDVKLISPPDQANNLNPPDGATDVNVFADLSWSGGLGATSYDVYLGTSSPGIFQCNQTDMIFNPGTMAGDTTYYWRVDSVNSKWGKTIGKVWSFTTFTLRASNPNPPDRGLGVSLTADLSWTAGPGAISHDVYFGTSNPPPFIDNHSLTTFDPGTMVYNTTYYWRIDEVGTAGKIKGLVWRFSTHSIPPPPPPPL